MSVLVLPMALAVGLATELWAEGDWQPSPIPLDTAFPESQPPRALLDQRVTVVLNANVAEVVRRLAEATGRDWVVSAPSEGFGPAKDFRANEVPLWQALDTLLEAFGYDWGVHAKVIVAWPATKPARLRAEVPAPEEETWADPAPREALAMDAPTPLADLLETLSRPWDEYGDHVGKYVYVAPEMRVWRVVGRIAKLDRVNGASIPLAVGAVTEYAGGVMALHYGTYRRLDDAFRYRASAPPEEEGPPELTLPKLRLKRAVVSSLTAQQWVFLRGFGEVQIAFRELPTETAALFLASADRVPRLQDGSLTVDWTQPQRFHVALRIGEVTVNKEDGTVLKSPQLHITCKMPVTDGGLAVF